MSVYILYKRDARPREAIAISTFVLLFFPAVAVKMVGCDHRNSAPNKKNTAAERVGL